MQVQVSIVGDKDVLNMLRRTKDGLVDLSAPMGDIGDYLKKYFSGVAFVSRGGVYGARWPALNATYERQKARRWGEKPMLIASGKMQSSQESKVDRMSVRVFNSARSRSGFDYPSAVQSGTRTMPARAFMGVNDAIEREINKIIDGHIARRIKGAR